MLHTATLLTDGNVLVAGGIDRHGATLNTAELWNFFEPSSAIKGGSLTAPRKDHSAALMSDGTVLLNGGSDGNGNPRQDGERFQPATGTFEVVDGAVLPVALVGDTPILVASLPSHGAVDVPVDAVIALRFSKPLRVHSLNTDTITLSGPKGIEQVKVVPAEGGTLAYVTPDADLLPGSTYSLTVNGAVDRDGLMLPVSGINFSTLPLAGDASGSGQATGTGLRNLDDSELGRGDGDGEWKGSLRDGKPHSDWEDLPPLRAPAKVTALAGQVLDLRGRPLADVMLQTEGHYGGATQTAQTDETGRFLIQTGAAGWNELLIDGRNARPRLNRESQALGPREDHGVFKYGLRIVEGETNVLPFTIWLPKIDKAHAVRIPSPTSAEVVVKNPRIPGLELRIPAGATITDHEGKSVQEVSLTQIPLDRTPFPLPSDVIPPVYFTAQPGGASISSVSGLGARIYYPNTFGQLPGTRHRFWHYDTGYRGWYIYGLGTVPEDGKQIVPDPGISIKEFTGAMVQDPANAPASGPKPSCEDPKKCGQGDPVDATTGLFVLNKTDVYIPDGIMPIQLTRTYRPGDTFARAFGLGASHNYDLFLVGDRNPYTYVDLIMPDGGRVHYDRISPGTGASTAIYEHTTTPTRYFKSKIAWNGNGWTLTLKDGTKLFFLDGLGASRPGEGGVIKIINRNGVQTSINRDSQGNVTSVIAPGGRRLEFTNASNRITAVTDNLGRTVSYEYDTTGRLIKVTDPNSGITEYTYDTSSRMLTVKDARGIVFLTNEYDGTGKVTKQTMIDGGEYLFDYTMSGSDITQLDVTDPRGKVTRTTLNTAGQILSYTKALGESEEQVTAYNIESGTNFILSETDPLNRTTAYTYDSMGNRTGVTRLSGTGDAVTTSFTYEPIFHRLTSITDPLNHTTTFGYDSLGNLTAITNPLNQTIAIARNGDQPVSITDPLNNTTQFEYDFGDLSSVTDPLGNLRTRLTDADGRVIRQTDPLGQTSIYDYDPLNRLTKVIDPLTGETSFGYDANGNLLSVTDARSNQTVYTYDNMDRLATRVDPLTRSESYQYDLNGNMTQFTDRKSQAASYTYDGINRRTGVTYADSSTTAYTYDKGNRLTQVVDSIAGTITRTYDGLNRLTSETTPQGSVSYTYDDAGRRTSMTVAGQTAVNYTYDDANRLTQITQGSSTTTYTYDAAGRKTSLTLPNDVLVEYTYDNASRLTEITYKQDGTTLLGNLTYEYDKNGNRTKTDGSFARTGLPHAVTSTAYNAANHQTTFDNKTLTYDNNGNLQTITDSGGTTTYTWNARNQLTGISGPGVSATFVYDGLGRREKKTINSNVTEFLYDGLNPVQETSGSTVLANILPGLGIDEFLTRTDTIAGVTSAFLTDVLGSPVAVTDNSGVVQTEYTYEPFGKTTVSGSSNTNPYQYTGRENDGTGLYYYRARFYHPQLQRFISEDPIEFGGGDINLYAYVGNSSPNFSDPYGLHYPIPFPFPGKDGSTCIVVGLGVRCWPSPPPNPNPKSSPQPPIPPDPAKPPVTPRPPSPQDACDQYCSNVPPDKSCTAGHSGTVCIGGRPINQPPPESLVDKIGQSIKEVIEFLLPGGSPYQY